MDVSAFDFDLPRALIAERPAVPRESARLLHVRQDGLGDWRVADLPELLRAGDMLVFNDTKVIPARLKGRRGAAGIEATLHERVGLSMWKAFARPARKLKPGDVIHWSGDFRAEVAEKGDGGEVTLAFDKSGDDLMRALETYGEMPLPPYIRRENGADEQDRRDYQTIFARDPGAVAAPTAGLHFTPGLLAALAAKDIARETLTLHVGAGTFLPVKVEDTRDHKMHSERGVMTAAAAARIAAAKAQGRRVVAVGTTVMRLLESAADETGAPHPFDGATDIFITPGYRFKLVDALMTNFHLPKSTLFMLVSAFAGLERMKTAYAYAKADGYRFYSYGDTSLLERAS